MDINVTRFFETAETHDFSASAMELGQNAGQITWRNAKREAAETPLLTSDSELDAMRDWMKESGGWDKTERNVFTPEDLNALFIQLISGDMNEIEALCSDDNGDINWHRAEAMAGRGRISGNLYRSSDQIWYYLGS